MKTTLLILLLLCSVLVFNTFQADAKNKKSPLIGEWVYEVSDAPDAYKTGTLVFSEKEGKIVCAIKLEAGELPASNLKVEDDKVTFVSYVEGSPVNVVLTLDKDKLTGTVDSPEGPKDITAVKKQ
ncbi:MAG TPA: hypothetical protein VK205_17045 [Prolixibacteraceae bacterium]|nr:hypothetical protein [Prolixibacteraceae bacterium]